MRRSTKLATAAAATLVAAAAGTFGRTTAADGHNDGPHVLFPGDGHAFGDARSTLSAAGFTGGHTFTLTCDPKTGRGAELGIQAQKVAAGNARSSSWQVSYSSAGGHGQVTIPMVTVFCDGADVTTEDCTIEF